MDAYEKQFDEYYAVYADAIFRYFFFRLTVRERALDLTQDVFTRFWEYLASGRTVANPKAFLYQSAHNAFVNELRGKRPIASLETLSESGFDIPYTDTEREEREAQQAVVERLSVLSEDTRGIFTMRYLDDLSVKEIAQMLGESENTISARLSRGRKKLKETYE